MLFIISLAIIPKAQYKKTDIEIKNITCDTTNTFISDLINFRFIKYIVTITNIASIIILT